MSEQPKDPEEQYLWSGPAEALSEAERVAFEKMKRRLAIMLRSPILRRAGPATPTEEASGD